MFFFEGFSFFSVPRVGGSNLIALVFEGDGNGRANAARASGDQSNFRHVVFLPCSDVGSIFE